MMKIFFKILAVILPATLISMFSTGCSETDTRGGVSIETKDSTHTSGRKEMFILWAEKNNDGTFAITFENNYLYPVPKFLLNGIETDRFNSVNIVPAGDVTYSIIWSGDTLKRTISLPDNDYGLARDTAATGYYYYITGHDGSEKVEWCNLPGSWIVFNDILPVNEKFFAPFTNGGGSVYGIVRPKDYEQIAPGYFATAESEKIAVYESIRLWSFFSSNIFW
jgi:hypothetical protein